MVNLKVKALKFKHILTMLAVWAYPSNAVIMHNKYLGVHPGPKRE